MVRFIEGDTIGSVWVQSVKAILAFGENVPDDKGMIRELSPLYLTITHPTVHDTIIENVGDKSMIVFMRQNFENVNPIAGWGYSYAQRISSQVDIVIQKLQTYPSTKSATISLLKPGEDHQHMPCLATVDFKIRQNRLCVHAFFRSQDIGKKMYADALALLQLGTSVAQSISIPGICLYCTICSAHIYEADISTMQQLIHRFR